ncbi:acetyltransferase (GNAT) family protein [Gelidibacter algens]|uniref:Acetyltransferase (GNAT) family protein n=1 Tax=Gelidibacter algens TaxID=49280 RepID=A0A1A7QUE4_9FLAO|nr:GNAT family N-acetyltransferase [Gelidibacter algens]OBX22152.1 hypothetical protein A9996_17235 [Gelidibacter algens]RAJ19983.1 acetyltransferase (GNAT) family protein [Gelidibacter algens]
MKIREAKEDDIKQMQIIINSGVGNKLSNSEYLRSYDHEELIFRKAKGWVCEIENQIVGFSILDIRGNRIWELFIRPEFEEKGIDRKLNDIMLDWYFSQLED